jgi:cell division protein ZapA
VELLVGGQRYRVVSSASPEELERLARVVDDKICSIVPPGRPITPQTLLLAAMALAHDLDEEKARYAALQRDAGSSLSRILGRVDEAIASIDAPPAANTRPELRAAEAHHGAGDPGEG